MLPLVAWCLLVAVLCSGVVPCAVATHAIPNDQLLIGPLLPTNSFTGWVFLILCVTANAWLVWEILVGIWRGKLIGKYNAHHNTLEVGVSRPLFIFYTGFIIWFALLMGVPKPWATAPWATASQS